MAKEQSKTKSFVLRVDAATMEALEKGSPGEMGRRRVPLDQRPAPVAHRRRPAPLRPPPRQKATVKHLLFAHDTIFSIFAANLMQIWGRRKS